MAYSMTADAAKRGFGALLDRVESTGVPVTVTRRSKPVAVIEPVPANHAASLENSPLAVDSDREFWSRVDAAREDVRAGRVSDARSIASRMRQRYDL